MKLLIYPSVSEARLQKIRAAAAPMTVVQAHSEAQAVAAIADADALFGTLTPAMLGAAPKLRRPRRRPRAWRSISIPPWSPRPSW